MKRVLIIATCGLVLVGVAGLCSCSMNNAPSVDVPPVEQVVTAPEVAPMVPEAVAVEPVVSDVIEQTVVPVEGQPSNTVMEVL